MSRNTGQSEARKRQVTENQEVFRKIQFQGLSTQGISSVCTANSTSDYVTAWASSESSVSQKQLRLAILAHIRAVRTLGRTDINTQEVADALGVSVHEVNGAIETLKKHGVRRR